MLRPAGLKRILLKSSMACRRRRISYETRGNEVRRRMEHAKRRAQKYFFIMRRQDKTGQVESEDVQDCVDERMAQTMSGYQYFIERVDGVHELGRLQLWYRESLRRCAQTVGKSSPAPQIRAETSAKTE